MPHIANDHRCVIAFREEHSSRKKKRRSEKRRADALVLRVKEVPRSRPADSESERHHLALPGTRRRVMEHCRRRLTRTLPTMSPIPTMPTTMHESEFYCFYVKETADSKSGKNIFFSTLLNLDLKLLRTNLVSRVLSLFLCI